MKSKLRQLATAAVVSAAFHSAPAAVRYVDVNSASPTPPYLSWATAGEEGSVRAYVQPGARASCLWTYARTPFPHYPRVVKKVGPDPIQYPDLE